MRKPFVGIYKEVLCCSTNVMLPLFLDFKLGFWLRFLYYSLLVGILGKAASKMDTSRHVFPLSFHVFTMP